MNTRLLKLWDSLRTSYWFVPAIMMFSALLLWGLTSTADRILSRRDTLPLSWLYYDDIDSMRTLILTITGTVVGVIGVVYSMTMIPLTIAATQFGPRLLRTFLRDRGTQVTLGTFTATFVFCLLVQLQLRDATARPQVSVNVGLFLGLCSFLILVYFINHVAVTIQASKLVAEVCDDLLKAIDRELPDGGGSGQAQIQKEPGVKEPLSGGQTVFARQSGYVQLLDDEGLLQWAADHNVVIRLLSSPGDFVVKGTLLAMVWPAGAESDSASTRINTAYMLGIQRTLVQDIVFGVNELVEVAIRALSPAINDPFTAMTCLDWLGAALCRLCSKAFPDGRRYDKEGSLRLLYNPVTFSQVADAAFNQIREYGRGSTAVTLHIMHVLGVVAGCTQTALQRSALLHHASLVQQGAQTGVMDAGSREQVAACYRQLQQRLAATNGHQQV